MWFLEKNVLNLCQTMAPEKQVFRGALKEFDHFFYFEICDLNRKSKQVYYNKINKTGYCIPWDQEYNACGYKDDISGGPLFTLDIKISKNEVARAYEISDLMEWQSLGMISIDQASDSRLYNDLTGIIQDSEINDNPIIMIVRLK